MSSGVNIGGVWKTVTGIKVNIGGTWKTATLAFVNIGGTWKQWLASLISDSFTRANSASLGTTETGQTWTNLKSTAWAIVSNQASNSGTATNYPIASVALGSQDTTTSVSTSQGCGPVVWISDANNWWASIHANTQPCNSPAVPTGYIYSASPSCACGSPESTTVSDCSGPATGYIYSSLPTCCGGATAQMTGGAFPTLMPAYTTSGDCGIAGGTWISGACYGDTRLWQCPSTAGSSTMYRCSNTTGAVVNNLRVIKSVAGTVTTVQDVALASAPAAIKVVTSGTSLVATAYSNTSMTTSLGTNTPTTGSPTRGTSTGIIKAPAGVGTQGTTVDSFSSST